MDNIFKKRMVVLNISKQTLAKRRKEQIQHKKNVMLERSKYQKKEIFEKNKLIQKTKKESLKFQEEKVKKEQLLEEGTKQQKIDEYKFFAKFAITLFASITAILIVNPNIIDIKVTDKENLTLSVIRESGLLEYSSIFLLSLSSLVSLVFNTLLGTPAKMNSSLKSFKKTRVIAVLIFLAALSSFAFILFFKLGLAEFFVGLIFVSFALFLCLVPWISKFILK